MHREGRSRGSRLVVRGGARQAAEGPVLPGHICSRGTGAHAGGYPAIWRGCQDELPHLRCGSKMWYMEMESLVKVDESATRLGSKLTRLPTQ